MQYHNGLFSQHQICQATQFILNISYMHFRQYTVAHIHALKSIISIIQKRTFTGFPYITHFPYWVGGLLPTIRYRQIFLGGGSSNKNEKLIWVNYWPRVYIPHICVEFGCKFRGKWLYTKKVCSRRKFECKWPLVQYLQYWHLNLISYNTLPIGGSKWDKECAKNLHNLHMKVIKHFHATLKPGTVAALLLYHTIMEKAVKT